MKPERRFGVSGVEPNVRVDPRSYRRYDTHAQIIDSLDTSGVAELYQRLEPLMTQAYDELGSPDTRFRSTLERAISHVLEVPVVEGPPVVMMGAAFYEYTDERLDSLTPVQKQFLGMGPDNVRTVQEKMRAVAGAIGLRITRYRPLGPTRSSGHEQGTLFSQRDRTHCGGMHFRAPTASPGRTGWYRETHGPRCLVSGQPTGRRYRRKRRARP